MMIIKYVCICELVENEESSGKYTPTVGDRFPMVEDDVNFPQMCPFFVFPTNAVLDTLEFHWFIITDGVGDKLYGYVYPLNRTKSLVVMSPKNFPLSFLRFFSKLSIQEGHVDLERIYHMQSNNIIIQPTTSPAVDSVLSTHAPYVDFPLFAFVDQHSNENLAYILRHTLLENSLLVITTHPNQGVLFLESLKALLYPFSWPHVEVPVANISWMHFLEAPVPFLMSLTAPCIQDLIDLVQNQCIELSPNCVVFDVQNDILYGNDFERLDVFQNETVEEVNMLLSLLSSKLDMIRQRGKVNVDNVKSLQIRSQTIRGSEVNRSLSMFRPISADQANNHRRQRSNMSRCALSISLSSSSPWLSIFGFNREIQFCFLSSLVVIFQDFEYFIKSVPKPNSANGDSNEAKVHMSDTFDLMNYLTPERFDPHYPYVGFLESFHKTQLFHVFIQQCENPASEKSLFRILCRASVCDYLGLQVSRFYSSYDGKLFKRGQLRKSWKKRDFLIEKGNLTVKYFSNNRLKGSISLDSASVENIYATPLQNIDAGAPTTYGIIITIARPTRRVLYCCAETQEKQRLWLDVFLSRVFLSNKTFLKFCSFYEVSMNPSHYTPANLKNYVTYDSGDMGNMLNDLISFDEKPSHPLAMPTPPSEGTEQSDSYFNNIVSSLLRYKA